MLKCDKMCKKFIRADACERIGQELREAGRAIRLCDTSLTLSEAERGGKEG